MSTLQDYIVEHLRSFTASLSGSLAYHLWLFEDKVELEEYIKRRKNSDTFSTKLLKLIDEKGLRDTQVYKAAGIDRRHFSKIRRNKDYRPSKPTVISLCLALNLSRKEADQLLELAGYSLSTSNIADLVVMFCIENKIFDLSEVNEALTRFGQKPLGT